MLSCLKDNYPSFYIRNGLYPFFLCGCGSYNHVLVISNCVIALVKTNPRYLSEIRPKASVPEAGYSSTLLSLTVRRPLPAAVRESAKEWVECVGGAELKDNYLRFISETGFEDVEILKEVPFIETDEGTEDYSSLLSLTVRAYKPL